MSVVATDLVFYGASSMPQDNTSLSGGPIDLSTKVIFTDIATTDKTTIISDFAGDTTQTITITGRDSTGAIVSKSLSLNGTTRVSDTTQSFERILKIVCSAIHSGTITVTHNNSPTFTSIATLESGILTVRRLYYDASADASGGSSRDYYEKVFAKNNNATNALNVAQIQENSDPTGFITFDLETPKSGTNSATNRLTSPVSGMQSSFDNSNKYVQNSSLGPQEYVGIWLKMTLAAGATPQKNTYTIRISGTTT